MYCRRLRGRLTAVFRRAAEVDTREAAAAVTAAHDNDDLCESCNSNKQKKKRTNGRLFPRKPDARYYHGKNVGTDDGYIRNSEQTGTPTCVRWSVVHTVIVSGGGGTGWRATGGQGNSRPAGQWEAAVAATATGHGQKPREQRSKYIYVN